MGGGKEKKAGGQGMGRRTRKKKKGRKFALKPEGSFFVWQSQQWRMLLWWGVS